MKHIIETQTIIKEEIEMAVCPFCGRDTGNVVYYAGSHGYSSSQAYVKCTWCGATGPIITDHDDSIYRQKLEKMAIEEWNCRSGD